MNKLYGNLVVIAIVAILVGAYALYKIPKAETITGHLNYQYDIEVEPGTIYKLSVESRAQGETEFAILAVSEARDFTQFPQNFTIPVLSKLLSDTGVYQLRVQVLHHDKVLYVNKGLSPLTREGLLSNLVIAMQVPPTPREKIIITSLKEAPIKAIKQVSTSKVVPEPISLNIDTLLGDKEWRLQAQTNSKAYLRFEIDKHYVVGNGGCNQFQGAYKIEGNSLFFNQFISSSKHCADLMEEENNFLEALPKVTNWSVKEGGKVLYFYDKYQQILLQFNTQ